MSKQLKDWLGAQKEHNLVSMFIDDTRPRHLTMYFYVFWELNWFALKPARMGRMSDGRLMTWGPPKSMDVYQSELFLGGSSIHIHSRMPAYLN